MVRTSQKIIDNGRVFEGWLLWVAASGGFRARGGERENRSTLPRCWNSV
jgi:hypothetical protein